MYLCQDGSPRREMVEREFEAQPLLEELELVKTNLQKLIDSQAASEQTGELTVLEDSPSSPRLPGRRGRVILGRLDVAPSSPRRHIPRAGARGVLRDSNPPPGSPDCTSPRASRSLASVWDEVEDGPISGLDCAPTSPRVPRPMSSVAVRGRITSTGRSSAWDELDSSPMSPVSTRARTSPAGRSTVWDDVLDVAPDSPITVRQRSGGARGRGQAKSYVNDTDPGRRSPDATPSSLRYVGPRPMGGVSPVRYLMNLPSEPGATPPSLARTLGRVGSLPSSPGSPWRLRPRSPGRRACPDGPIPPCTATSRDQLWDVSGSLTAMRPVDRSPSPFGSGLPDLLRREGTSLAEDLIRDRFAKVVIGY